MTPLQYGTTKGNGHKSTVEGRWYVWLPNEDVIVAGPFDTEAEAKAHQETYRDFPGDEYYSDFEQQDEMARQDERTYHEERIAQWPSPKGPIHPSCY